MSSKNIPGNTPPHITTLEEMLAYALVLETEAAERYTELAGLMAEHNNLEVSELFQKLGRIEQIHADDIRKMSEGRVLPKISPWEYRWSGPESPEALDSSELHYLITPHQAVKLALRGEQRAADFYGAVVHTAKSKDVQDLAREYEKDEQEHVRLLNGWLERYPEPAPDWDEDPDSPVEQE